MAVRGCSAETWQDSPMDVTGQMESQTHHLSQVSHTACTKSLQSNTGPLSLESHFHHQSTMHSNTVIQDLAQHHLEVNILSPHFMQKLCRLFDPKTFLKFLKYSPLYELLKCVYCE